MNVSFLEAAGAASLPSLPVRAGGPARETARPRPAAAGRERTGRLPRRGSFAQILTLSLAAVTLAVAGSTVTAAILVTGSARPSDWSPQDLSLAAGRYQACTHGQAAPAAAICLSEIGPPASRSVAHRDRGVRYVTATVTQPVPPAAVPGPRVIAAAPAARAVAPGGAQQPAQPVQPVQPARNQAAAQSPPAGSAEIDDNTPGTPQPQSGSASPVAPPVGNH